MQSPAKGQQNSPQNHSKKPLETHQEAFLCQNLLNGNRKSDTGSALFQHPKLDIPYRRIGIGSKIGAIRVEGGPHAIPPEIERFLHTVDHHS